MKHPPASAVLIPVILISGVLLYGSLTRGHDWGGDFAAYIMQAGSLLDDSTQTFLEANRFAVEQSSRRLFPVAYPWGLPVLLAPLYAVFGLDPFALKALSILSYLLFLAVLWPTFRSTHSTPWLVCLVSFFAVNPVFIKFSDSILSDLPFLLVSTLCLWQINRITVETGHKKAIWQAYAPAGLMIAFAYTIRTNGILLLIIYCLTQLFSHFRHRPDSGQTINPDKPSSVSTKTSLSRWHPTKKLLLPESIPCFVFLLLFILYHSYFPDGGTSHLLHLKNITPQTILTNFCAYVGLPRYMLFGTPGGHILYAASIPLALFGAFKRRGSDIPSILYIGVSLLFYSFWPEAPALRYLFPVMPFYVSFVLSGLESLRCIPRAGKVRTLLTSVCIGPVIFAIVFSGYVSFDNMRQNIRNDRSTETGPFEPAAREMFVFIADHTEADSVIAFFKPRVMRLMTGRRSIMIDRSDQLHRADYLCVYLGPDAYDQLAADDLGNLLSTGNLRLMLQNDCFKVYRLHKNRQMN